MRSYQEHSKVPVNTSKLENTSDYDGMKKYETHKIMIHPS